MLQRVWATLLPLWGWVPKPLRWWVTWTLSPKFVVGVAGVILNEQGEVMLFRHTYRREFPWALPGGLLKRGEDAARAVEREVMEESGLSVCIERPWKVQTWNKGELLDLIFVGRWTGGTFRPSAEVSEMGFFRPDNLPHLDRETRELLDSVWESR